MLYFETPGGFVPYQRGDAFPDGTRTAADIERHWSDAELAAVGLFRVDPNAPTPPPYNPTPANILTAPSQGFGGPNGKELFNGNR